MAYWAKLEVSRCTIPINRDRLSGNLTIFYALTDLIRVPLTALFQTGLVFFGLYVGLLIHFNPPSRKTSADAKVRSIPR